MKIILIIAVFIDNIYHNGYVANIKIKNNNYNINPNMCNVKKCNVLKKHVGGYLCVIYVFFMCYLCVF